MNGSYLSFCSDNSQCLSGCCSDESLTCSYDHCKDDLMTFIVTMGINTLFWTLVSVVFLCLARFKMKDASYGYKEQLMLIT